MTSKHHQQEMFSSSSDSQHSEEDDSEPQIQKKQKRSPSHRTSRFEKKLQLVTVLNQQQALKQHQRDSILDFLEATEASGAADNGAQQASSAVEENSYNSNELQTFKDDDDFYVQMCKSNNKQSAEEIRIAELVRKRSGKIISKVPGGGGLYTVLCFKNHVFDANGETLKAKWCPSCETLRKLISDFAESLQGGLDSQFLGPNLHFRCKHFHRWVSPEANIMKAKPWCPRCPDVLSLMITHHHKGVSHEMEKILQIEEQAELIAEGYVETNLKNDDDENEIDEDDGGDDDAEDRSDFQNLKDLYFIQLIDVDVYRKYLNSALPKKQDQLQEYHEKMAMFNPESNSHPLASAVQEKLTKLFDHVLDKPPADEDRLHDDHNEDDEE